MQRPDATLCVRACVCWLASPALSPGHTHSATDTLLVLGAGAGSPNVKGLALVVLTATFAVKQISMLTLGSNVRDLDVLATSPWYNGAHEPAAVVAVLQDGRVASYDLHQSTYGRLCDAWTRTRDAARPLPPPPQATQLRP